MTARDRRLRLKYGITEAEYEELLAVQGGRCAICGRLPRKGGRRLSVDHDHKVAKKTGVRGSLRGILCWGCNVGLRHFRDDSVSLLSASNYILCPPAWAVFPVDRGT